MSAPEIFLEIQILLCQLSLNEYQGISSCKHIARGKQTPFFINILEQFRIKTSSNPAVIISKYFCRYSSLNNKHVGENFVVRR